MDDINAKPSAIAAGSSRFILGKCQSCMKDSLPRLGDLNV
jgi:hypothetical protein